MVNIDDWITNLTVLYSNQHRHRIRWHWIGLNTPFNPECQTQQTHIKPVPDNIDLLKHAFGQPREKHNRSDLNRNQQQYWSPFSGRSCMSGTPGRCGNTMPSSSVHVDVCSGPENHFCHVTLRILLLVPCCCCACLYPGCSPSHRICSPRFRQQR